MLIAVTAVILYPFIVPLLTSTKNKRKAFRIFVFWSWVVRIFGFYFVKRVEQKELPNGPYMIVANHASYLDIFLMYSILPNEPFLFLGKSEILSYPLIKTFFKRLNIPVYRNNRLKAAQSVVQAIEEINNGWSIVIFPEGGIPDEDNPKMIPFKKGAFIMAKQTGIPIVPITFINNFILFSDPTKILGPAMPGISKVYIHEYISSETVNEMDLQQLSDHCFSIINQPLLKKYPHLIE
jgi:1-acyl-sn-glycerol-3-phosphate acyltransferase